ncbi:hypothetical protein STXM2123_3535 [Streptomyces sp. F-3]|nr:MULTISPECIES: hypothetical protein [Streptomyces]MDN5381594.1 hypothetical protein [Streptomyces sp. LB8]GAT82834.1 hypothetical protein STXM2123_3535 [Streptomyces sp. F-3]
MSIYPLLKIDDNVIVKKLLPTHRNGSRSDRLKSSGKVGAAGKGSAKA